MLAYAFQPAIPWHQGDTEGPKHISLPFDINLTFPDIPFLFWFWLVVGACVFWFLCAIWVLVSARYATSLESRLHAFVLDVIITCVFPGLGSIFSLLFFKNFFNHRNVGFSSQSCKYCFQFLTAATPNTVPLWPSYVRYICDFPLILVVDRWRQNHLLERRTLYFACGVQCGDSHLLSPLPPRPTSCAINEGALHELSIRM